MKGTILPIFVLLAVGTVMAQQPQAASRAPAAGAAGVSTNMAQPWLELRDVQAKLHPMEEGLAETDPEVKAIILRRKEAQQMLLDLDKKRRALVEAKLMANPAAAPLLKRRAELLAKMQEMRPTPLDIGPAADANRPGAPAPAH